MCVGGGGNVISPYNLPPHSPPPQKKREGKKRIPATLHYKFAKGKPILGRIALLRMPVYR